MGLVNWIWDDYNQLGTRPSLVIYHLISNAHLLNIKHLMTGPVGNSEFCFPRISDYLNVSRDEVEGNIEIRGKQNFSKTNQKQNLKTALRFQRSRATAINISRVTVNCFPFDVIVFARSPAHGIWQETVSLLDVMWPWTSQWMGVL